MEHPCHSVPSVRGNGFSGSIGGLPTWVNKIAVLRTALFCVGMGFAGRVIRAGTSTGRSQLTVPWEEFKKLVRMDDNEIVFPLETFHKLTAQTGVKTTPPT